MQQRHNWDFGQLPTDAEHEALRLESRMKSEIHQAQQRRLRMEAELKAVEESKVNSEPT